MQHIDDDDKPTITSGAGWRQDVASNRPPQTAVPSYAEPEERPTIVKRKEPEIAIVAWIYCLKGLRRGQLLQMKKARNEFGSATDCDLQIEDNFASNHHGAFVLDDTAWKLYDFASTNGTLVNGQRVGSPELPGPVELSDGDRIEIGESEFVFKRI